MQTAALQLHAQFTAWTEEAVLWRFIEAADTMRRLPPVNGPMAYGSTMPDIVRNYADAVGAEENRDPKEWQESFYRKPKATAAGIRRMEEVFDWQREYLNAVPWESRPLWLYALSKALHFSFKRACQKRGWQRQTAYRRRDEALRKVRRALNAAHIPLETADAQYLDTMDKCP